MSVIAVLLRQAADHIDAGEIDMAAWRVADAGGLLREKLDAQRQFEHPLAGLEEPTGRGYMLPRAQEAGE